MTLHALLDEAVLRLRDAGRVMDAERLDGASAMLHHLVSDEQGWGNPEEPDLQARLRLIAESADVALRILARERDGGPDGGIAADSQR